MKLIDKTAVIAEIESLRCTTFTNFDEGVNAAVQCLIDSINTIEIKEVDIEKEISQFIDANFEKATTGHKISLRRTARYFYELGLKT